ncbi:protein ITPRID2 [Aplochiton taeniatus]
MNSSGSGKSSATVSSVSELLDLCEEDPEEVLYNLGFGREEPDIASKIPPRFFSGSSCARGIDIKVYLDAQLQRMELESPSYALTSRFRQIEVLTTVANEFIQLYSQVSGQPVQRIGLEGGGGEEVQEHLPLKRNHSALNAAKILKKTITRHNLLANLPPSDTHTHYNSTSPSSHPERVLERRAEDRGSSTKSDQRGETKLKACRKKDSPSLANGFTEESSSSSAQKEDTEQQTKHLNPHTKHLLIQTKDSFEMEEVQSNDDEILPATRSAFRTGTEMMRTTSQQSDSSGFAEDPSDGSPGYLKVQDSSDSCDSETTVTSPAGEVTTPLALDHPAFDRLLAHAEEETDSTAVDPGKCGVIAPGGQEEIPLYSVHHLPRGQSQAPTADCPPEDQGCTASCSLGASQRLHTALQRAQHQVCSGRTPGERVNLQPRDLLLGRGKGRGRAPLERSSSLPSSLLSPSRVVSSVRVQFGRGLVTHCTPPSYCYRYSPMEEEEPEARCRSTLLVNPTLNQNADQSIGAEPGGEGPVSAPLPRSIPHPLTRSSYSLCSPSPPPDWPERPPGEQAQSWSPWSLPSPGPAHYHSVSDLYQYPPTAPTMPHHSSLYNLHHQPTAPSMPHHSSLYNLHHQPTAPSMPHHSSLYNLHHQPTAPSMPHHSSLYNLHHQPTAPSMQTSPLLHDYSSSPYHTPPTSYHGYPYTFNPPASGPYVGLQSAFSLPSPYHCPASAPSYHPAYPGPAPNPAPGSSPGLQAPGPSSSEMQLRRVLHEIRGTVQSLAQADDEMIVFQLPDRAGTPSDIFNHQRAAQPVHQSSVRELQEKRRSLSMFRTQMMDLELSIIQQQALVYPHLTLEDRQQALQLQSLRSAVRQQLQDLETQLEDRLDAEQHTLRTGVQRGHRVDSLSNSSALHAMEPMSDLLREQMCLQAELGYLDRASIGHTPSSGCSSRSTDSKTTPVGLPLPRPQESYLYQSPGGLPLPRPQEAYLYQSPGGLPLPRLQ